MPRLCAQPQPYLDREFKGWGRRQSNYMGALEAGPDKPDQTEAISDFGVEYYAVGAAVEVILSLAHVHGAERVANPFPVRRRCMGCSMR